MKFRVTPKFGETYFIDFEYNIYSAYFKGVVKIVNIWKSGSRRYFDAVIINVLEERGGYYKGGRYGFPISALVSGKKYEIS